MSYALKTCIRYTEETSVMKEDGDDRLFELESSSDIEYQPNLPSKFSRTQSYL